MIPPGRPASVGGRPGISRRPGGAPPGWSSNPSRWAHRLPIVAVALFGFVIASYLALCQLGVFERVWEPFFEPGAARVLERSVLPIPDAAVGAALWFFDAVIGLVGGRERWRTAPAVVLTFGAGVLALGVGSLVLAVAQPLLYDTFCTLCLASALLAAALIGPTSAEVLATLQHLHRTRAHEGPWGRGP